MKMEDYNRAMDEIHANQQTILKKLTDEPGVNRPATSAFKNPRMILAAALAVFLLAGTLLKLPLPGQETPFSITVHAAGTDSLLLSTEPVIVQHTAAPQFQALAAADGKGIVNYQLWFQCEGENIAAITYRCSDTPVDRNNYSEASHYFVADWTVPVEERGQYDYIRSLQSSADQAEGICQLVELIGNEYTVSYEEQDQKNLGIELQVTTADSPDPIAKAEAFTIDVILTFTDGHTQTVALYLEPMEDAFDGILIQVVE